MATEREVAIERVGKRAACFIPARQICCCLHGFELHAAAPTRRPFLDVARCFDSRLRIARARTLPIIRKKRTVPARHGCRLSAYDAGVESCYYKTVRRTEIQQMHRVLSSDRTPAGASLHFRAGSANRQPASVDDTPAAPIPGWAIRVRLPPTVWRSAAGYGCACGVWVGTGHRVSDFKSDSRGAARGGHRPVILGPFAAALWCSVGRVSHSRSDKIERNTALAAALSLRTNPSRCPPLLSVCGIGRLCIPPTHT